MLEASDLCLCGHTMRGHIVTEELQGNACLACMLENLDEPEINWDAFHDFQLDNLRYLERKYDDR